MGAILSYYKILQSRIERLSDSKKLILIESLENGYYIDDLKEELCVGLLEYSGSVVDDLLIDLTRDAIKGTVNLGKEGAKHAYRKMFSPSFEKTLEKAIEEKDPKKQLRYFKDILNKAKSEKFQFKPTPQQKESGNVNLYKKLYIAKTRKSLISSLVNDFRSHKNFPLQLYSNVIKKLGQEIMQIKKQFNKEK